MPPRAQKKPAVAKKPSPKPAAKPDPAPAAPAPAPAAEEAPAAPAPVPATEEVTVEETVVTTEVVEEKVVVEEVTAEEAAPEEEVEPEEDEVEPEEEVEPMEEEEEEAAEDGDGDGDGADLDEDVKKVEQKAGAAVVGAGDNQPSGGDNNRSDTGDENAEDDEEEEDLSMLLQPHLIDKKENKETEIFVGKLDKEAVEDDLVKVFGVFGELQSVRIVKRPDTQRSKGFGFVRFVNTEHAKKALTELKDGVQVKGKEVRISASHDNDTLYLGNINKLWSKDTVTNALKELGVDQIKDIVLPNDPKKEGKTKGYALIEFCSHADAVAAFKRLRKPDAVFGCERSVKVAFSTSLHPNQENMVKSVYVEGLPESWDEGRVKEACNQYGEIEKVRLLKSKKKDIGFVDFTSHESAVACVKGLHNAQLGEGDIKVKANLAKLPTKDRRVQPYQEPRGGFPVKKDGEVSEEPLQTKKKDVSNRGKTRSKGAKGSPASKQESKPQPSKSQGKTTPGKRRDRRGVDTVTNDRPSKKPRNTNDGNRHGRLANSFDNQRAIYMTHPTTYAPSYALPAPSYQPHAYAGPSASYRRHSDLEPHGGYLPAGRGAHYVSQPSSGFGYTRAAVHQPPYQGYPGYPGYEDPYGYPSSRAYAPRRGYY